MSKFYASVNKKPDDGPMSKGYASVTEEPDDGPLSQVLHILTENHKHFKENQQNIISLIQVNIFYGQK